MGKLDKEGREVLDSRPMAIPVGYQIPETLEQKIARMVLVERLSQDSAARGGETFEESLDFDIEDDPIDRTTPWESLADAESAVQEDLRILAAAKKRIKRARAQKPVTSAVPKEPAKPAPVAAPADVK